MPVALFEGGVPEAERFAAVRQSKTPTIPPKTTVPDAAESMVAAQIQPATQPLDPTITMALRGLEGLGKVAEAVAKQPGGKGPYVFAGLVSIVCSLIFSVGAVWVHDQSTTGRIGARLDDHDEAIAAASGAVKAQGEDIKALVEVVGGLIDEGESDMDWMEEALAAGFAGRPIPKRSAAGRNRLRRMVPTP